MSRPKPKVLMQHQLGGKIEQILAADAIYAVFLNGQPINIKILSTYLDIMGPKYKKSSFSNSGHAFNLADRLNRALNTTGFEVYRLTGGEKIVEPDE